MNIGKACAIFMNIESDEYTDVEKGEAILHVIKMPTHNGIAKDCILKVVKWLLYMSFDVKEEGGNEDERKE